MKRRLNFIRQRFLRPAALLAAVAILAAGLPSRASAEPPRNLLLKSTFDDAVRADFPHGWDYGRLPRFSATDGLPSPDRVELALNQAAARFGGQGADILLKVQQNFAFWFPLAQPLPVRKNEERLFLVRFWVRGDDRLEDGAFTRVAWSLPICNSQGSPVWSEQKIRLEFIRLPGAPNFSVQGARAPQEIQYTYFRDWTMLGATLKATGLEDGHTLAGLVFYTAKKGGDPTVPMRLQVDQVELFDITSLSDSEIGLLMQGMAESSSEERRTAILEREAALRTKDSPGQPGNHIRNASFETNGDYQWILSGGSPINPEAYLAGNAWHGRRCLAFSRLRTLAGMPSELIESPAIAVRPFRKMLLSAWARKEDPGKPARFSMAVTEGDFKADFDTALNGDWQRFSLPITVGSRYLGGLGFQVRGNNILLDALQLEEGTSATPFRDADAWSVALVNDGRGNIQFLDQPFEVVLQAFASNQPAGRLSGRLVVTDLFGRSVAEVPFQREAPPGGWLEEKVVFDRNLRGIFNVAFLREASNPLGLREASETVVARVPRPVEIPPLESIIGETPYFNDFNLSLLERLGVKWARTIPSNISAFRWSQTETRPGVYDWSFADRIMEMVKNRPIAILGHLNGAPEFHGRPRSYSSNHGGFAPADMEAWSEFVSGAIRRYGSRVAAWEVWNEPSKEDGKLYYNEAQAAAFKAVKQVDPKAFVVAWSMPESSGAAQRYASLTPGDEALLDGLDIHIYGPANRGFLSGLKRGVGNRLGRIPVWNTECGLAQPASMYRYSGRDEVSSRVSQAAAMAQLVLVHKAIDAKFFYYTSRFPHMASGLGGYSWGVIESTGVPSTGGVARAVAAHFVDGGRTAGYVERDDAFGLVVRRDGRTRVALFTYAYTNEYPSKLNLAASLDLKLPAGLRGADIFNLMGQPQGKAGETLKVTYTPVYLDLGPADPEAALEALRTAMAPAAGK
ncbi:MAG TPA: hypothetical protein PKN80_01245 [bacterium]|uniref:GH10 domain-containing protein n=1 Tax=candidate division TA06 bacterium ADurb.Bin417 TaxID=1852828 RepID=A0A1V5MHT7_UNCT6|nr:MAG: hypothetical protein BWY73_00641 [candidate division TA06 bacterium ADurb.Bin417]HNQ34673.1 hypothetical protein [bacterium]HNS48967.1 hypothetical protein [bacterium]